MAFPEIEKNLICGNERMIRMNAGEKDLQKSSSVFIMDTVECVRMFPWIPSAVHALHLWEIWDIMASVGKNMPGDMSGDTV